MDGWPLDPHRQTFELAATAADYRDQANESFGKGGHIVDHQTGKTLQAVLRGKARRILRFRICIAGFTGVPVMATSVGAKNASVISAPVATGGPASAAWMLLVAVGRPLRSAVSGSIRPLWPDFPDPDDPMLGCGWRVERDRQSCTRGGVPSARRSVADR